MVFHSYTFIFIFLPVVFSLYLIFRRASYANLILLVASYIFYTGGSLFLFASLACVSVLDYYWGLKIYNTSSEQRKKIYLSISLTGSLLWLFAFKYLAWFTDVANSIFLKFHWNVVIPKVSLPYPTGVSFYTFQTMSYILDIYRGNQVPEQNFLTYLTYVSFFPQLVAGPIERASNLLNQIRKVRDRVTSQIFEAGVFRICWGVCKKIVFADNLGHLVNLCLKALRIPGLGLIAVYAFGFQIYCDFSAYTDIATGTAKLFNVNLSRNFLTPYFSTSPADFWRRWHISLSSWLRDYIYTPLAVNRRNWGKVGVILTLMVTFILCGFWHGAGKFFLIWGVYQGILMSFYFLVPIDQILIKKLGGFGRICSIIFMFQLTFFGWLLFRSNSENIFMPVLLNIKALFSKPFDPAFWPYAYILVLFSIPIVLTDFLGFRKNCEFVDLYSNCQFPIKVFLFVLVFYMICLLGKREAYDFIYFAF